VGAPFAAPRFRAARCSHLRALTCCSTAVRASASRWMASPFCILVEDAETLRAIRKFIGENTAVRAPASRCMASPFCILFEDANHSAQSEIQQ